MVATEVMVVMTAMVMAAMVMDIAVMEVTAMGIVMERDTGGVIDVALMSMMLLLLPMSTAMPLFIPLPTPLSIPLLTALSIPLLTALSMLLYTAKLPLSTPMPIGVDRGSLAVYRSMDRAVSRGMDRAVS